MPIDIQLLEGIPLLDTYYMYITSGCNLACRHCWISPTFVKGEIANNQYLDYSLYKVAIDDGIPLGLTSIKFTGGEPLLHPNFISMVDYATEKGLRTWLETNGTLLTQSLANYLKEKTSLFFVSVSLDGALATTHDYLRSVSGSFENAQKGIAYLVEAGYNPQIIMSLYPGNISEIEALVHWANENGCGSVKFNLIQPLGRGQQMNQHDGILEIEEQVRLGNWIEKDLQQQVSIPLLYSWPIAFHGLKRLQNGRVGTCKIHNILGVISTGHLAMCGIGTQEKELIYGQLGVDTLADIWTSHPVLFRLRDQIPAYLEGICSECILKDRCVGYCVAENFYSTGRLTAPFWFCRQAFEVGLFPSTRRRLHEVCSKEL